MIQINLPESLSALMERAVAIGLKHHKLHISKIGAVFSPKKTSGKKQNIYWNERFLHQKKTSEKNKNSYRTARM
jgi:hypothetical protein